jgi:hypothetical protein
VLSRLGFGLLRLIVFGSLVFSKQNISEVRDSNTAVKKSGGEAGAKRPRNETPSPSPAFKVQKNLRKDFDKMSLYKLFILSIIYRHE